MLTPTSLAPGAEKRMVGSVFVCEAESLADVRRLMEGDVYYTGGVVSRLRRPSSAPGRLSLNRYSLRGGGSAV